MYADIRLQLMLLLIGELRLRQFEYVPPVKRLCFNACFFPYSLWGRDVLIGLTKLGIRVFGRLW